MVSPMLFLRLLAGSCSSPRSAHQSGYGLVLPYISLICSVFGRRAVEPEGRPLRLAGLEPGVSAEAGLDVAVAWIGSTWTMCSHDCTMAFMRDVLPMPAVLARAPLISS